MPHVSRIEILHGVAQKILITDRLHDIPGEQNLAGNAKAVAGINVLYDKSDGIGMNTEHVYACVPDKDDPDVLPELLVEVKGFKGDLLGRQSFLSVCYRDKEADKSCCIFKSPQITIDSDKISFRFHCTFRIDPDYNIPEAPFGIWDTLTFSLDGIPEFREDIKLEFYCLTAASLPNVFKQGIPLSLLRMFILAKPEVNRPKTTEEWIAHVVSVVHGSRAPFSGAPSHTSKHWLRYDSRAARFSFTSAWGGASFNIRAWLDAYYNWKTYGTYTYVNCYDQAAITEIVLSLGLPHDQIHWEYHQVYGFIRDTQLVGWGACNNPFFCEDTSKMNFGPVDDSDYFGIHREPLRHHAYLSWTTRLFTNADYVEYNRMMKTVKTYAQYQERARKFENDRGVTMLMLDACLGPHLGTETREQYEAPRLPFGTRGVGYSNNYWARADFWQSRRERAGNPKIRPRWNEQHRLGPGISQPNWYSNQLKPILSPGKLAAFELEHQHIIGKFEDAASGFSNICTEWLHNCWREKFMELTKVRPAWGPFQWVTIRPYTHSYGGNISESKVYFPRYEGKQKLNAFLSLRVCEARSAERARAQLAAHLLFVKFAGRFQAEWFNAFDQSGVTSMYLGDSGTLCAFLYKNIACELQRIIPDGQGHRDTCASVVQTLLAASKHVEGGNGMR